MVGWSSAHIRRNISAIQVDKVQQNRMAAILRRWLYTTTSHWWRGNACINIVAKNASTARTATLLWTWKRRLKIMWSSRNARIVDRWLLIWISTEWTAKKRKHVFAMACHIRTELDRWYFVGTVNDYRPMRITKNAIQAISRKTDFYTDRVKKDEW